MKKLVKMKLSIQLTNLKVLARSIQNYNKIVDILENEFIKILGRKVTDPERHSFQNSLSKMNEVLKNEQLHEKDCGVLIEYNLPQSSMRLDFMITGKDKFLNSKATSVKE